MNIAQKYFKQQLQNDEFKHTYLSEKIKLDIEYKLEELKEENRSNKSSDDPYIF